MRIRIPRVGAVELTAYFTRPQRKFESIAREPVRKSPRLTLIRVIGVLALLVVGYAIWMQFGPPTSREARCGHTTPPRLLRLEFAQSTEEVKSAIGDLGDDRRCLIRVQILRDNYWVPMYLLLFLAVSLLLARRNRPRARYLAGAAITSASAAAVFDWKENYYVLQILNLDPNNPSPLFVLREATLSKWTLIFATMSFLAVAFFNLSRWASLVGFLYVATAVVGLGGIFFHPILASISYLLALGLSVLAIGTLFSPQSFAEPSY
jgi:hypothetical protein